MIQISSQQSSLHDPDQLHAFMQQLLSRTPMPFSSANYWAVKKFPGTGAKQSFIRSPKWESQNMQPVRKYLQTGFNFNAHRNAADFTKSCRQNLKLQEELSTWLMDKIAHYFHGLSPFHKGP